MITMRGGRSREATNSSMCRPVVSFRGRPTSLARVVCRDFGFGGRTLVLVVLLVGSRPLFSGLRALTRLLDARDSPLTRGSSRFPNRGCDIDCFHRRAATVFLNALTGVQLFDDLPKPGVG
jgi:hypothetical protein